MASAMLPKTILKKLALCYLSNLKGERILGTPTKPQYD